MKRQRSLQPHPRSSAADADHSLAVRGTDLQKAMEHVAAIAGDNPVHAFETAMHAVTSQLAQGAASGGTPACAPGPMHGPGRAGLLHRRAGSSMDCFADVAIARMESGWALNATDLLGISANPGEMGEWYVLTPGEQGGRRAFRIDANAAGLRLHPAPPAARSTPFNAHLLSLDNVRVADDDAWDLGPAQAPSETFMRLVSVYRAMAAALCCGLGRATRSILSAPAIPATARGAVPAARQARSGQQLGKIDALLLTSDIVMRGIASDLARERPFPQASSTRLHRLAVDSSLAAVSLAWRGGIRETHTGFASLRRYRRDALAVAALMAVLDGVDVPTPA
jgi:hypothetical protein